jgi:hypothetical protein
LPLWYLQTLLLLQNSAKVSATRKYKYQNRKQTAGNLENNFGDVDVEWWLIDDDRV